MNYNSVNMISASAFSITGPKRAKKKRAPQVDLKTLLLLDALKDKKKPTDTSKDSSWKDTLLLLSLTKGEKKTGCTPKKACQPMPKPRREYNPYAQFGPAPAPVPVKGPYSGNPRDPFGGYAWF